MEDIQRKLSSRLDLYSINLKEYQNKFYIKERIKEVLPDLPEVEIYKAIEGSWNKLKTPIKKSVFIKEVLSFLNNN